MKILHAIRGLANSSGTTHIVGPLAEAQSRLGHEVTVFTVEKSNEKSVLPDRSLVESRVFPMTIPSKHYGWSRSLKQSMRQCCNDFDVIHIHAIWNYTTWCTMREAQRAGVPYVVAPQGSLENWALGRSRHLKQLYSYLFEKSGFDRAARMQALTQAEAEQCKRYGIRSATAILPNGVTIQDIDQSGGIIDIRKQYEIPANNKVILFLGRIFPKKGLDLLSDAFGEIVRERDDITLLVAGHDAGTGYLETIRDRITQQGAAHKTRFIGEVRGNEKFQLLKSVDLFVLSSYSEGLPVAIVEAMGCGCPVVVTPDCNVPEVKTHNAGWITPTNSSDLKQTLLQAFSDLDELKCRGRNARLLVECKFTWDKIAARSLEIYQEIITA